MMNQSSRPRNSQTRSEYEKTRNYVWCPQNSVALLLLVAISLVVVFSDRQPDAQDASTSNAFYDQIRHIASVDQLTPLLDTEDPQNARLIVIRLVDLDKAAALPILRALWTEDYPPHVVNHMDTYRHTIVRLTLADQLMTLSPAAEYGDYIKHTARQDDGWIIKSLAAEALATVDDRDAIDLLVHLAHTENRFIAESAVASLSRIARYGEHVAEASQAIATLHDDPEIEQERVKSKIDEAYQAIDTQNLKSTNAATEQGGMLLDENRLLDQKLQPYLEKQQYQNAISTLLPAAQDGNVHAQHLTGELYLATNPPNYDRAREWLLKAAMKGYAPAKTSLANLYPSGRGVQKDEAEAVRLLQEAEQQGDPSAHLLLEKARKHGWWGM